MSVQAYINYNGNCREAVEYYAEVFGTEKPQIMFYRDVPLDEDFPLTEETMDLVMHTSLDIEGSTVMFSDVPPGMSLITGNNVSLVIISKDMDKIKAMFDKLKGDGTVGMDLQETFWSKLYGFVTDKFGVGWQFNYDNELEQFNQK
ncbi:VOC family protein [Methanolobus psychrotolerans]|uniref:VOC family protein n=1 Tax=Methanolobus psychrotolerans TaxID=1874706 RepID=UPI000B91B314|nr:glyoxalase/bleomycin resistance/extradiol dioxygenase family protein [Methanolobus psychrotolerans]